MLNKAFCSFFLPKILLYLKDHLLKEKALFILEPIFRLTRVLDLDPSLKPALYYTNTVKSRKQVDLYYKSDSNKTRGKLQKTYYAI